MIGGASMKRNYEHAESCEYIHVHEDIVEKVNAQMPAEDDLDDLADFFKIFGDTTRIKMLYVLLCSEMCEMCIRDRDFYSQGKNDILFYNAQRLAGNPHGCGNLGRFIRHDYHIRRFNGCVASQAAHGDSDIRPCQDRRVVNAISHKYPVSYTHL